VSKPASVLPDTWTDPKPGESFRRPTQGRDHSQPNTPGQGQPSPGQPGCLRVERHVPDL